MERFKCVVCLKVCSPIDNKTKDKNVTDDVIDLTDEGESTSNEINPVNYQKQVMFLLQKILQVPENVYSSFNLFEDQESGINCCDPCWILVKEGEGAFHHVIQLQQRYENLQCELKNAIVKSIKSETVAIVKSTNAVTQAVRLYFKKGIIASHKKCEGNTPFRDVEKPNEKENSNTLPRTEDEGNAVVDVGNNNLIGHKCESFKCGTCGKDFAESLLMQKEKTRTIETPFKCKICGKIIAIAPILKDHMDRHQLETLTGKPRSPPKSSKKSPKPHKKSTKQVSSDSEKRKSSKSHKKSSKQVSSDSEKRKSSKSHKKSSKQVSSDSKKRRKAVTSCDSISAKDPVHSDSKKGEVVGDSIDLGKDVKAAETENPFKCPQCGKYFTVLQSLRVHMKLCEQKEQQKPVLVTPTKKTLDQGEQNYYKKIESNPNYDIIREEISPKTSSHEPTGEEENVLKNNHELAVEEDNTPDNNHGPTVEEDNTNCMLTLKVPQKLASLDKEKSSEQSNENKPSYKCHLCGKECVGSVNFLEHLKSHTKKVYKCTACGLKFDVPEKLTEHKKSHAGKNAYSCNKCNCTFSTLYSLRSHKWTHREKTDLDNLLVCVVCKLTCKTPSSLKRHQVNNHKVNIEKRFQCNFCGMFFPTSNENKEHMKTHREGKPYKCEECGKCFGWASLLRDHKTRHLGIKFKCELCGKCFLSQIILGQHIRRHKRGEKQFPCNDCGKMYFNRAELKDHLVTHSKERPHKCEICGKCFKRVCHRNRHVRKVHNPLKIKYIRPKKSTKINEESKILKAKIKAAKRNEIVKCKICGKLCKRLAGLQAHMFVHDNEPFQCETCGKFILGNRLFKNHMTRHLRRKPHLCKICDRRFESAYLLKSHNRNYHKKYDAFYKCVVCEKTFLKRDSLQIHLRTHSQNPVDCKMCGKGFENNETRNEHWLNHSDCRYYACGVCWDRFSFKDDLQKHLKTHYNKEKNLTTTCKICSVRCSMRYLKIHMRSHIEGKPHNCEFCGRSFSDPDVLKAHMNIHTKEEYFSCEICGKKYLKLNILHHHMKTHIPPKPRARKSQHDIRNEFEGYYNTTSTNITKLRKCNMKKKVSPSICEICGSTSTKIKSHMKIHSLEKDYICKVCNKGFNTAAVLKDHMNTHDGKKPYKCKQCGKSFAWISVCRSHQKRHSNERTNKCNSCDKSFVRKDELRLHMRSHTNEKPFQCQHCGKSFTDKGSLTKHIRIHTGEKPYKCNICERAFTQSYTLVLHKRRHAQSPKE